MRRFLPFHRRWRGLIGWGDASLAKPEYDETLNKARGLLKAIEITQQRAMN